MPFRSESQRRFFWAKVNRGEISKATAEEWERETKGKKLPERVSSKEERNFRVRQRWLRRRRKSAVKQKK